MARFITSAFSRERDRYVYNGSRRLFISEEDRRQLSERRLSDYSSLTADPAKRMHWERVHGKCGKGKTGPYAGDRDSGVCPAIRYRNRQEGTSGTVKPVSYRHHPHYTGDIYYAFSEEFIERNSRFGDGCRDVCADAPNRLSEHCSP
ncbi:MAG: hypothetical protein LBB73_06445 [Dysgonamonadaceae bacterium]|nr:hypothetical protein [Dysgonamonadaceae bacterium]